MPGELFPKEDSTLWRLETSLRADSAPILAAVVKEQGVDASEALRRAVGVLGMAKAAEYSERSVLAVDVHGTQRTLPTPSELTPPREALPYSVKLDADLQEKTAGALQMFETVEGTSIDETVDQALHYYGELLQVKFGGEVVMQTDDVGGLVDFDVTATPPA